MKLQMSLDKIEYEAAMKLIEEVHDVIDIIEVGTPQVAIQGLNMVREIKKRYPDNIVLADTKIMDGGEYLPAEEFKAGADIVTVLAVAEDETIKKVIKTAKKYHKQVLVDMIAVRNLEERVKTVDEWGADYIGVHVGVDIQGTGRSPLEELRKITAIAKHTKTAVAGGVNLEMLPDLVKENPGIIICGGFIVNNENPRQAIIDMKKMMV